MRIVISLTTLPNRYDYLLKTLQCLQEQTVKPDVIYLSIPHKAKRLNQEYPSLPENPCTVVRCPEDYGPICKIYGALIHEQHPDTIIITVDDDVLYPIDFIETFVNKSKIYPDAAITGTGVLLGNNGFFSINTTMKNFTKWNGLIGFNIKNYRCVDVVQGFSGVLYKRRFFDHNDNLYKNLFTYTNDLDIFKSDDILLSAYLCKKKIKRITFNDMPIVKNCTESPDALSGDLFKMIATFNRTVQKCIDLKMFIHFEKLSMTESPVFKIPLFILMIILLCLFVLFIYFHF